MKLLKFTLISILGLSLCTACGGDGDGGETPGPGKPEGPDKSSTTGIDRFDASNIFSRNTYLPDNTAMQGFNLDSDGLGLVHAALQHEPGAAELGPRAAQQDPGRADREQGLHETHLLRPRDEPPPSKRTAPTVTCGPGPTASATPKASTGTKNWWGASNT